MKSCPLSKGFVATIKENFGFLETSEHDKEVFFHYRFVIQHQMLLINPVQYTYKEYHLSYSLTGTLWISHTLLETDLDHLIDM